MSPIIDNKYLLYSNEMAFLALVRACLNSSLSTWLPDFKVRLESKSLDFIRCFIFRVIHGGGLEEHADIFLLGTCFSTRASIIDLKRHQLSSTEKFGAEYNKSLHSVFKLFFKSSTSVLL